MMKKADARVGSNQDFTIRAVAGAYHRIMTPAPMISDRTARRASEMLLSPDFWSHQMASAFKAWAIIVPLLFLTFAAGIKIKSVAAANALLRVKAHTEAVEARLELARELNVGEAKAIEDIRND